jgi:hypothetical protein
MYGFKICEVQVDQSRIDVNTYRPPALQYLPGGKPCSRKTWAELWEEIRMLRPAGQFLPNLRRVHIYNSQPDSILPFVGASGAKLSSLRVHGYKQAAKGGLVPRFLTGFQDISTLECLHLQYGEPIPGELLQRASLKDLRLWSHMLLRICRPFLYSGIILQPEILKIPTLETLTLALSRDWYTPEIRALGKYLPTLKHLWLDLCPFMPEWCINSPCTNQRVDSWTCCTDTPFWEVTRHMRNDPQNLGECNRQPPSLFIEGLDNPELRMLKIDLPKAANGNMFLDVMSAASRNCQLQGLTDLVLSTKGWVCRHCIVHPRGGLSPPQLRQGLRALLPLPQLRTLRISAAPNFLVGLDMQWYREAAEAMPALETLCLGHREWAGTRRADPVEEERTPLRNIAAFCSFFQRLTRLELATLALRNIENPDSGWECSSVKVVVIRQWIPTSTPQDRRNTLIRNWFPDAELCSEYNREYETRFSFQHWEA